MAVIIHKMTSNFKALNIQQLDEALEAYRKVSASPRPAAGWAKAIREALGMTRDQLAKRMGISPSTVSDLERNEARGTITLESLARLAGGMDCEVVYAIVPREGKTLDTAVRQRAESVAAKQMARISHTMRLEEQGLDEKQEKRQVARIVDSLLAGSRRNLWR
jgi:predicted DNA-binding mobile mystery protein A